MAKFQKTSLQLSPVVLRDMDNWPGLSRSEALRLAVERGHYLSTLNSVKIADLAETYAPILRRALEDLGYEDYKVVVRSLPSLVTGLLCEDSENGLGWRSDDGQPLQTGDLVDELKKLDPIERIGLLDCVVAERHRREEEKGKAE